MPAQAMKRLARLSLAGFALLAITLFAEARLGTSDAAAQIEPQVAGDGTVIFGGTSQGASNDLTVGVSATEDYLISATVPGGGDFYGAGITIQFDSTKVSAFCEVETVATVGPYTIRMVCNDDVSGQVTVVLEGYPTNLSTGMTGTATFGVIEFTGIANTPNAITDVDVTTNCINGDEETITDCDLDFAAVAVGEVGGGWLPGDVNCDTLVNVGDITRLRNIILSKPGAALGSCAGVRGDLNCDSSVNVGDITRLRNVILAKPGAVILQVCPVVSNLQFHPASGESGTIAHGGADA